MTRLIGGVWGGRTVHTPPGTTTRPTAERIRGALGNALASSGALAGAAVLDLYAGSGALGLELLSRGAASLVAVERDAAAVQALRRTAADLRLRDELEVVVGDVAAVLPRLAGRRFDVVVADPPYAVTTAELRAVLAPLGGMLTGGADVVVERGVRSGEVDWPPPLAAVRSKRYGDTLLCYGRAP